MASFCFHLLRGGVFLKRNSFPPPPPPYIQCSQSGPKHHYSSWRRRRKGVVYYCCCGGARAKKKFDLDGKKKAICEKFVSIKELRIYNFSTIYVQHRRLKEPRIPWWDHWPALRTKKNLELSNWCILSYSTFEWGQMRRNSTRCTCDWDQMGREKVQEKRCQFLAPPLCWRTWSSSQSLYFTLYTVHKKICLALVKSAQEYCTNLQSLRINF